MRKKIVMMVLVLLMAGLAQAVLFTGSNTGNNLLSDTNNWEGLTLPVTSDNITISASGTSVSNPAVFDAAFNVDLNQALIFSGTGGGTGMAYAEVVSGATLKATLVYVGNGANQWYDGTLTLRAGSATVARYLNSGNLTIGGDDAGELGFVNVEPGVSFAHAILILKPNGTLRYEFGANSVSPFIPSKSNAAGVNTLNGLVQVDLGALVNEGSYALIEGSSTVLIAGAMKTWLDGESGSFSGTGDFANASFQVINGGTMDWTLSLENGDQDLVFTVSGGGLEEEDFGLFGDTFDRADSLDINLNAAGSQSGPLAPLTYEVYANDTPSVSAISSNEVLLSMDGSGNLRFVPLVDLSDSSTAILDAGGFEISYTVDAGVDFTNTVHGHYASSLILAQASMVASAGSGIANSWQGLFITIKGNGQVTINSQGSQLLNVERADYDNAWGVSQPNDVRLVVETDGFMNTSSNSFTLYINGVEVGSSDFNWKTSNDLSFGLEAVSYSALFNNLELSKIAPEKFTTNGVPYSWLDSYYTGLNTDADYETAANTDTDGDGFTGQEEFRTGTDPTDPASRFAFSGVVLDGGGLIVTWPSVEMELYSLSNSASLTMPMWDLAASNLVGLASETSYTTTPSEVTGFFKVNLQ